MRVSKDELHRLVDILPESETRTAKSFLEFLSRKADQELTLEQVAKKLDVSPRKVRQWLCEGLLPGRKTGRKWQIKESDLEPYLDPVAKALLMATKDDEPLTQEDELALAEARNDLMAGRVVSHKEARQRLLNP